MIKNDLINRVTDATGVPRQTATAAVETIIDVMRQSLARGGCEVNADGQRTVRERKRDGHGRATGDVLERPDLVISTSDLTLGCGRLRRPRA